MKLQCKITNLSYDNYKDKIEEFFEKHDINSKSPLVRKEFAKLACVQKGEVRPIMFLLYDGRMDKLHDLCQMIVFREGKLISKEKK